MNCKLCGTKLVNRHPITQYCYDCIDNRIKINRTRNRKKHSQSELVIKNVLPWHGMEHYRKQCERVAARYEA